MNQVNAYEQAFIYREPIGMHMTHAMCQKQVNCMTDNHNCLIKSHDFIPKKLQYITVYTNVLLSEILACFTTKQ